MTSGALPKADGARPAPAAAPGTLGASFDLQHNAIAFLRVMLSVLVIWGHSWELGGYGRDPLARQTGVPLGVFAVHAFFVIGGFLVAGSFEHSRSWRRYLANRALRLFPAYWACLLVTAALLIPAGHALSSGTTDAAQALRYVVANLSLRIFQPTVGDLFAGHPASGIINGSLWSLFPEILCYTFLAVAGVAGMLRARGRWALAVVGVTAWLLYACTPGILARAEGSPWHPKLWYLLQLDSLLAFFCGGALLWVFRAQIPFSAPVRHAVIAAAAVVLLSGGHRVLGPLLLPPAMLALAVLVPVHRFDRHGDFSYGLYLYHYPLQQLLFAAGLRDASPFLFFAAALLLTFPFAWLSWQLVERPALKLKPRSLHRAGA